MLKVYDKAQWHIDGGENEKEVVTKFKELFDFLNSKKLLTDEGKEIIELGVDSSAVIHERMVTKDGNDFLSNYYDNIINSNPKAFLEDLAKEYKNFKSVK